jgi:hypothetical protein
MQTMLQRSELAIVTCADGEFDGALVDFLQRTFPDPGSIMVHRYAAGALIRSLLVTQNAASWEAQVTASLLAGQRVAICCRTRMQAEAFAKLFQPLAPRLLLLTSRTPKYESRVVMRDFTEALYDCRLCIVTSKVAFGLDCQTPWDRVFVDASPARGCTMRHLFQMVGRWRNLRDTTVPFLVHRGFGTRNEGGARRADFTAHEASLKELYDKQADTRRWQGLSFQTRWSQEEQKIVDYAPDAFTSLLAHHQAESRRSDRVNFERLAALKAWPWDFADDGYAGWSEQFKEAKLAVADEEVARRAAARQFALQDEAKMSEEQKADLEFELARLNDRAVQAEDEEDVLRRACLRVTQSFEGVLTDAELEFAQKHMSQIRHVCQRQRMNARGWLNLDARAAQRDFHDLFAQFKCPLHDAMNRIAAELGLSSPFPVRANDVQGVKAAQKLLKATKRKARTIDGVLRVPIDPAVFTQKAAVLLDLCREVRKCVRARPLRTTNALTAVRAAFKDVYHVNLVRSKFNGRYFLEMDPMLFGLVSRSLVRRIVLEGLGADDQDPDLGSDCFPPAAADSEPSDSTASDSQGSSSEAD